MKLTFGKYKGKDISKVPRSYLEWMVKNLKSGDLHKYAQAAEEYLNSDDIKLEIETEDVETLATEFLKAHGYNKHGRRK